MKRKARRRLVGAVVLALGAAIVLPLLLEKEPRPLGDDVSVQIPPVDEGKFVNRLTGKAGDAKALPKAETKAIAAAPGKSEVKPDVPAESAPASPPAPPPQRTSAEEGGRPKREQRVSAPSAISAPKADAKVRQPPSRRARPNPQRRPKPRPRRHRVEQRSEARARRGRIRRPRRRPRLRPRHRPRRPRKPMASSCSSPRSPTTKAPTRSRTS